LGEALAVYLVSWNCGNDLRPGSERSLNSTLDVTEIDVLTANRGGSR
jgi:hypothetical protein